MTLEALFGSRVRADALRALAVTSKPLSGYKVAKSVGAQPIHVIAVLKRLVPTVERVGAGWVLRDDNLRRYLLEEIRQEDRARREEKDELLRGVGLRPSLEHGRTGVRRHHPRGTHS